VPSGLGAFLVLVVTQRLTLMIDGIPHCYSRGQVVPMCCRALLQEVCLNHAGTSLWSALPYCN